MTLAFDEAGTGPAVLLLHSSVCDRRMWDPQLPSLLRAGLRVVRCDLPGFGETPVPDRPVDAAAEVVALLDTMGIGRTAIVGASMGGRIAQEVAARWPQRVTALVLLCTAVAGHSPGPELAEFDAREEELLEAGDIAGATELNVDLWLGPSASPGTRDLVRRMQRHAFEVQLAAPDVAPIRVPYQLSAVTAPSLVVSGGHDVADFREIAVRVAAQLGGRHLHLEWAGHLPSLERPDEVNALLVEFLRTVHPQWSWTNTTHDWSGTVDVGHIDAVRAQPSTFAPGGAVHLVLEVLAYAVDEAAARGGGTAVVTLHPDGSVSVADDGRGTDTRRTTAGQALRKPVMATPDLRFFDDPGSPALPDGHPRRGMSVVGALSRWLVHTNRRLDGAWTQRYEHGLPTTDLVEVAPDGTTGTTVHFLPDPDLVATRLDGLAHLLLAAKTPLRVRLSDLR